jgi:2-iminobutanoate/2-iminopropanoate deaminase
LTKRRIPDQRSRQSRKPTAAGSRIGLSDERRRGGDGAASKGKSLARRIVSTERAPRPVGPYSQGVVAANTVYVAGQGPIDPYTGEIVTGTFEEQAIQTFENVRAILEASGASLAEVVKVNIYLADLSDFARMNEIYKRYFPDNQPARATVGAQLLFHTFIEVDCIAVKRDA